MYIVVFSWASPPGQGTTCILMPVGFVLPCCNTPGVARARSLITGRGCSHVGALDTYMQFLLLNFQYTVI